MPHLKFGVWIMLIMMLVLSSPCRAANPYMVKEIFPGATDSPTPPQDMMTIGNTLYFTTYGEDLGVELWKSDGTPGGTVNVKDIRTGPGSSDPVLIGTVNGVQIFEAYDGAGTRKMWRTDGTLAGTSMLKDIRTPKMYNLTVPYYQAYRSNKWNLTIGATLFFGAALQEPYPMNVELFKTDGTAPGTSMVVDLRGPDNFTLVNGLLYFVADANDSSLGDEIWKSNGTAAGTHPISDVIAGMYSGWPTNLTDVNGTCFFQAVPSNDVGYELFKTAGTLASTVMVKDINPTVDHSSIPKSSSSPANITNLNGVAIFSANDGSAGTELWRSDGIEAGTYMIKDMNPGSGGCNLRCFTAIKDFVLFVKDNDLYKTDGTTPGTKLVKTFTSFGAAAPVLIGAKIYFAANDGSHGEELWVSDGTAAGTTLVKDINPGGDASSPRELTVAARTLYFSASDGTHGRELWAFTFNAGAENWEGYR